MSDAALESYLRTWREANPQRATAWLFLRPVERVRFGALAAMQQEWLDAIRDIREPQVAISKLGWWREEMERAIHGEARHPLSVALFAHLDMRAVPLVCWQAAIDAALLRIDAPPAADFGGQRESVMPLARALAVQEIRAACTADAPVDKAAGATALGLLVNALRAIAIEASHGRPALPMNLLARHGLTTDMLGQDSPARRAALRDQVGQLEQALMEVDKMTGPLTLLRRVQILRDLQSLRAARLTQDPLRGLLQQHGGVRNLLKIWRAARISRHTSTHGIHHATT